MLEEASISCPYCGEGITLLADCSAGDQSYIEDCSVCCQPIMVTVHVAVNGELAGIDASQENP